MVLDINWESYFTPSFTPGFSDGKAWYKPWRLASLNLGGVNDTLPKTYQYVPNQTWADRSQDLIAYAEVTKTLRFGSTAQIIIDTPSDRDIFEISDNEVLSGMTHIGQMLPRMKFPYRVHRINLQAKGDAMMPTNMFVGHLVDASIQSLSDIANDNQDGRWRVELNFVSFDHVRGLLGRNKGAPLWHHRANNTTDNYHIAFRSSDTLTFDSAITQIVAWMNTSRPTTDFPVTFSYTPKGTDPYKRKIGSNPIGFTGTVTFTNGSAAVTTSPTNNGNFLVELQVGQAIRRLGDGDDKWGYIASITDKDNLVLKANYTGTTGTGGEKTPINDVIPVDGSSTWQVLEKLLAYMGAVEALGLKYIPTCSATGVIDITQGGYDKTAAVDEDFRGTYGAQNGVAFTPNINFNLVSVPFSAGGADKEFWIKFTLYKWNGSSYDTVFTSPSSGYEYVPYDANNIQYRKYYKVPTQVANAQYKWTADLVTAGMFTIANVGGSVFSPQNYQFLNSPLRIDYSKINSFLVTRGLCYEYGGYGTGVVGAGVSPQGCKDGGITANGGNQKCTDNGAWGGCYPDPSATPAEAVNPTYGIQGAFAKVNTLSALNKWDTVCRLHSKKLYTCQLNTDSLIRAPISGTVIFNDGYTGDMVGKYIEVYSPELDDMVTLRIVEQRHVFANGRLPTILKGYRI